MHFLYANLHIIALYYHVEKADGKGLKGALDGCKMNLGEIVEVTVPENADAERL